MNGQTEFEIGAPVTAGKHEVGRVQRVIMNPVKRVVTHVVVSPPHDSAKSKLVPVASLAVSGEGLSFTGTPQEFADLEPAVEEHFVPATGDMAGYGSGAVSSWPLYQGLGFSGGTLGMGVMSGGGPAMMGVPAHDVVEETIPLGEVALRRGESVHASDGPIGKVEGLVVDGSDHHLTHILLQEGHLWGKKQVAIPMTAVTSLDDGIHLSLTRSEVEQLPAIAVDKFS